MTQKKFLAVTVLALALLIVVLGAAVASAQAPVAQTGSISGNVYCDANNNGSFDTGEGVAGVAVSAYSVPCGTPYSAATEGSPLAIQESGIDGLYSVVAAPIVPQVDNCFGLWVDNMDPDLGMCILPSDVPPMPVVLTDQEPNAVGKHFGFVNSWKLLINGDPWAPGFEVTVETSDTVEVVASVAVPVDFPVVGEYTFVESWVTDQLSLTSSSQVGGLDPIVGNGVLTWTIVLGEGQGTEATITKTFHIEPCTWPETTVFEELALKYLQQEIPGQPLPDLRPFVIKKTAPLLHIDSTYESEVDPGTQASFVLAYSNTGGYENDVMIRNDFPASAPFASANPAPDRAANNLSTGESWAEWDVGDLAGGARGEITVNVAIGADLPPSTTIPITDHIYNHVDAIADTVVSTFHILQPPLELGDYVWLDTNQDGIQDAGEFGVQGIGVALHRRDCAQPELATDVTDENGDYLFTDLHPGIYCIQFSDIPAGWLISPQSQGADDTVDSDADPATARIENIDLRETDLDEDMGLYYIPPPEPSSLGDLVWYDTDQDGIQDASESGIAGVGVTLYDCEGNQLRTATTASGGTYSRNGMAQGAYLFNDLEAGSYQIGFALPTSDYEFSLQNQGADDALDSDADPVSGRTACIVIAAGVDDMDWDAGMYEVIIEAEPPPIVPEASTLLLLGSALSGLAGYAGLQIRARRRK